MGFDILSSVIQQIRLYDQTELILYVVASLFAAVMIGKSVSSYIKTGLINLKYATVVLILFCAFFAYENLEHLLSVDLPTIGILIPATGLAIMTFFFLSPTKRN